VGVAKTGNELGLSPGEIAASDADQLRRRLERAAARLIRSGAHYVVESIADLDPCIEDIQRRLGRSEKP
jgi:phosphonoacetaldehyde hydrolase